MLNNFLKKTSHLLFLQLTIILAVVSSPLFANTTNQSDSLDNLINTIAYGECDTLISTNDGYSPQEVWAWNTRLCLGAEVDMSLYPKDKSRNKKNRCDINNYKKWPRTRELSTNLIFLIHKYTNKFKFSGGAGIKCATFNEEINIYNVKNMTFSFDTSIFKNDLSITGLLNNSSIFISNSSFKKNINIPSKSLSSLIIKNTNIIGTLDLVGSVIDSILIIESKIGNSLSAVGSHILSSVIIANTSFKPKNPDEKHKKSHVDFSSADIDGSLIIYSDTKIEGDLLLGNAHIKQGVSINNTVINGELDLSNILIKDGLIINKTKTKSLSAQYSNILRYVDLSNSIFESVSFNSAKIEGRVVALNIQCDNLFNFNGTEILGAFLIRGEKNKKVKLDTVNFATLRINNNLEIANAVINNAIDASSIYVNGNLSLTDSKLDFINLDSATLNGNLIFSRTVSSNKIDARNIRIKGSVYLNESSSFIKKINFDGADIQGNFKATNSNFKSVLSLQNSTIGGFVDISDSKLTTFLSNSSTFKKNFFANDVKISQKLNLNGARILRSIFIKGNGKGKIEKIKKTGAFTKNHINSIDLRATEVGINVQILDTKVKNSIKAGQMKVGGNFMLEDSNLSDFNISNTKINSNLYLTGSSFSGEINAEGINIASSLYLTNGIYNEKVQLNSAKIGNYLNTKNSTFKKYLGLQQAHISSITFSIENKGSTSSFSMIDLYSSNIENHIILAAATQVTELDLKNSIIGGNLSLASSNFTGGIFADSAEIGNNLFIGGLAINNVVDLSNITIGKALVMYSQNKKTPNWGKESKLLLRNTHVKSLVDHENSWVIKDKNQFILTDLTNFSYENWGSSNKSGDVAIGQRSTTWLVNWLKSQISKNHNPQPYRNLSDSLKKHGYDEKAESILIAMKQNQLDTNGGFILRLQQWFIDFGYNPLKALWWFSGLFFLALFSYYLRPFIFNMESTFIKKGFLKSCLYTLQVITPGIGFEETHNTWFDYIFRIAGFIIISFLIAGLSGLIK